MAAHGLICSLLVVLLVAQPLAALDLSQLCFYAPLDGTTTARIAGGSAEALPGLNAQFVPGIRGQAVKLGQSTWGSTSELPTIRMPVDVGLWRSYGTQESLGPLRYPAAGNIGAAEGTLSLWYKPLGWSLSNYRDHFIANLGMSGSLAIAYLTYFGCLSFQNSVGENDYTRCIAYLPPEVTASSEARQAWTHLAMAWGDQLMKTWLNGKPLAVEHEGVIPLRNASGELRFGSGDHEEAAIDDVMILTRSIGDAEARALYQRNAADPAEGFLAVPPIAAPTIDGKQSSATEWQGAACFTSWADGLLGVANGDSTAVKIGHDGTHLYVAFLWPIPEKYKQERTRYVGSPVKVTAHDRDADLSPDDTVTVLLAPPRAAEGPPPEVFSFAANGGGALRDEKNGDPAWDGDWQAKQACDEDYWMVEFALPLDMFGRPPAAGKWGINFSHSGRQVDLVESVWCFQPATERPLAGMTLSTLPLAVQIAGVGNLSEGVLALRGAIVNHSAEACSGATEVQIAEDGKPVFGPEATSWTLPAGEAAQVRAAHALPRPMYAALVVNVTGPDGSPLLRYRLPFVFSRELKLQARYAPTPQILQAVLDFGSTSTLQKATSGEIRVASAESHEVLLSALLPAFTRVRDTYELDCSSIPVGKYEVVAEIRIGEVPVVLKDSLEKTPRPEWLGNKLGCSDQVPAPWTPLRVEPGPAALSVSCWGRTYSFGAAGLPSQVNILGQDILAGPARLLITMGGETRPVPLETLTMRESTEGRVSFETASQVEDVDVSSAQWMEFDGFVWNTLRLSGKRPTEVQGLALEFPLKPEFATLWWPAEYVPHGPGGETPKTEYTCDPINGMRIGDEEHGLQFGFETKGTWAVDAGKGQQLLPGENAYVVRYNLIARPVTIGKPLEFSFGLQALPCKPRSPYFRRIDMDGCWSGLEKPDKSYIERTGKLFYIRPVYTEGWSRHWNYLNFWNPEVFEPDFADRLAQSYKQAWETQRNTLCMYLNVTTSDANTPEYRQYRWEWRPVPGDAPYVPPDPATRDKATVTSVCVQAPSYSDFYAWYLNKAARAISGDGAIPIHAYLDNSGMISCANTLHGCPKEGHTNLLAHRQYVKRLYTILKSLNPLNQVLVHCSGDNRMSSWAFSDVMIEGEQMTAYYLSKLANDPTLPKDYTRLITLAKARSQFQPLAYGPDRLYLYQFWGWNKSEPHEARPARAHLLGLMMVHDSPCWAAGMARNIVQAIEELGWDQDVAFVPYWRKDNGLSVNARARPVVASAWQRHDGNLLVMVFNDSDQADQVTLRVDFARFGFKSGPVRCRDYGHGGLAYPDSLAPQEVRETSLNPEDPVNLDIGHRSYRLLRFYQ